jgi:integrase
MPSEVLTDARLARLAVAPGVKRLVVFDQHQDAPRGFCVRVTPSGERAFYFVKRALGRKVWVRIGDAGALSLAAARKAAHVRAGELAKGIDPNAVTRQANVEARAERAIAKREADALTVAELVRAYVETRTLAPRTASEYQRTIEHDIAPSALGRRKAADVVQADVRAFARALAKRGKHQADRALLLIRYAFHWGAREDVSPGVKHVTNDPTNGVERLTLQADRERRRTLVSIKATDDREAFAEVRKFWLGTEGMRPVPRAFVRVLLLLGLRRGEAGAATWGDLELEGDSPTWHVPADRRKVRVTRRDADRDSLDVPLAPLAVKTLQEIRPKKSPTASVPVFPQLHAGSVAVSMWHHTGIRDIRLHDLRRSCATAILRLGGPPHILTDVLGHRQRGTADSDAVYLQGRRMAEYREWLLRWATTLGGLVEQPRKGRAVGKKERA